MPLSTYEATTISSTQEAINNQDGSSQTVEGYIVGKPLSSSSIQTSSFSDDYSIAIADDQDETSTENMLYIQLTSDYRSTFGLDTNSSILADKISVTGTLTSYYGHAGLKSPQSIEFSSESTVNSEIEEYYQSAENKTGDTLKRSLHAIIDDHVELSYNDVWNALRYTDQDPDNSNNVILIYTGRSQSKYRNGNGIDDWNREHVWAKSHGDFGTSKGEGTDLHHIRPSDMTVNSSRGNKDFDNGGTAQGEADDTFYDSDSWEPRDEVKGDIARMIFYMAVRYEGDSGELDLEVNDFVSNDSSPYHGKLSTLLEWHNEDPVDDFERTRNDIIYEDYQQNRNPFIDHPEWVEEIWN
ncbi:endonuclease [Bacillus carboniphilus]|uniref:Endonuclease n=1 Tax=Bacillus carboniphilus TaxID=86663 RepID=A0ABY9K0K7_9BACI|nr:endonuclease [Bacillus carboniphilus]WLR44372.1 endonuclease [Bacillus carboniphilus]